ncbi:hypothetical protein CRUP_004847 [Coryphaenoides rupestris]|nr:hypothetical protein CRUP_004847 [Coryphaenoides rupestris]
MLQLRAHDPEADPAGGQRPLQAESQHVGRAEPSQRAGEPLHPGAAVVGVGLPPPDPVAGRRLQQRRPDPVLAGRLPSQLH